MPWHISLANRKTGVLGLDDIIPESHGLTTRDVLKDKCPPRDVGKNKHPSDKQACRESLLLDSLEIVLSTVT